MVRSVELVSSLVNARHIGTSIMRRERVPYNWMGVAAATQRGVAECWRVDPETLWPRAPWHSRLPETPVVHKDAVLLLLTQRYCSTPSKNFQNLPNRTNALRRLLSHTQKYKRPMNVLYTLADNSTSWNSFLALLIVVLHGIRRGSEDS